MNKLMRKLSISILAVVFAVIAMGATTYAWFTLTDTAKVEQFQVGITTAAGIELSIDNGASWSSVVTPTQFAAGLVVQTVTIPALTAVASVNAETFHVLATLPATGLATFTPADTTHYLQFAVQVRTTTATQPIYLSNSNTSITGTPINWVVDQAFTPSSGTPVAAAASLTVNPADAVRMAFKAAATHVFQNPAEGTNTAGESFVWTSGALNYFQNKKGYVTPTAPVTVPLTHENYVSTYTANSLGTAYTTAVATTGSLSGSYATVTVTVRIWLDGWDAECYNAIFNGQLFVNIGFTTNPSAV